MLNTELVNYSAMLVDVEKLMLELKKDIIGLPTIRMEVVSFLQETGEEVTMEKRSS